MLKFSRLTFGAMLFSVQTAILAGISGALIALAVILISAHTLNDWQTVLVVAFYVVFYVGPVCAATFLGAYASRTPRKASRTRAEGYWALVAAALPINLYALSQIRTANAYAWFFPAFSILVVFIGEKAYARVWRTLEALETETPVRA